MPRWQEKYGDLCWKVGPWQQGREVWAVVTRATRAASSTCQTCPSPGRKRVIWVGEEWGGMPWVKTCCDACYSGPPYAHDSRQYQWLVEQYEDRRRLPARDAAATVSAEGGHMAIVVLRELRKEMSQDFGPGNPVSCIEAVHAAPEVSGAPDDRSFCGKPTPDMERVNYQPEPGAPWLPPNMQEWECHDCAAALRPQ